MIVGWRSPFVGVKHHSWQWDRLLRTCKASIGCSWHEPTRKHRSHLWTEEKKTRHQSIDAAACVCVYLYVSYTCDCSTCFGNSLTMASSSTGILLPGLCHFHWRPIPSPPANASWLMPRTWGKCQRCVWEALLLSTVSVYVKALGKQYGYGSKLNIE